MSSDADAGNGLPRRILVPIGHDEAGQAALDQAASLAAALRAELVVLGITPLTLQAEPVPGGLLLAEDVAAEQKQLEALTRTRVEQARKRIPEAVRSRAIFAQDPAGPAIVDAAGEVAADLVVVPMQRGSGLSHVFRDGTDRHVLHHSPVPVLVVPDGSR
jgi:nucleotide-binding universal stress UspA family protein